MTQKYQIAENHTLSVDIAVKLGCPEQALMIQFFYNMIALHKRLNRNQYDGRTWNYVTYQELAEIFPYWTQKQVRRIVGHLTEKEILITGNYNKIKYDQTVWYAFKNESEWGISNNSYVCPNGQMKNPERADDNCPNGHTNTNVLPISNPIVYQDNVKELGETLASCKEKNKTLDIQRRWKLSDLQYASFKWLQSKDLNTDIPTLAYWSKTYSIDRLKDVYNYSKTYASSNVGGYINKILKKGSVVDNETTKINKETAINFKAEHNWSSLTILEKYAKILLTSGSYEEIPYNIDYISFYCKLENIYQNQG